MTDIVALRLPQKRRHKSGHAKNIWCQVVVVLVLVWRFTLKKI